jgi:alpha-L-rhamnosidase
MVNTCELQHGASIQPGTKTDSECRESRVPRLRLGVRWQVCATPLSHAVADTFHKLTSFERNTRMNYSTEQVSNATNREAPSKAVSPEHLRGCHRTPGPCGSPNGSWKSPWKFVFLLIMFMASAAFGRPSAPVRLLVNGISNPLAIDRDLTSFTWMSKDANRGERQTAYQIVVFESPSSTPAVWWDSGKVDSDKSASVKYAGKPLPAATRFWWKVRVWDQTGHASRYSPPAYFDTGLNQDEWTAQYIWDGTSNLNNFAYFRKAFTVDREPSLAKVYVTAHNDYLLYLNGQPLGRGPARCDPYHHGQYNGYDITRMLKIGTNVFAAMGHWQGNWNDSGVNAKPAFLLEAHLNFPDGSSSTITSDDSWKVLAQTAFIETNAFFGFSVPKRTVPPPKNRENPPHMWTIPDESTHLPPECVECDWMNGGASNRAAIQFDSRREPADWINVGFDDSKWASATVVYRSLYHLFAQTAPLEREQDALKPVSIIFTNGAWLVDFGRCIDGWPKITMRANQPGDEVQVEYFQMTGEQKEAGWDKYICHGGTETWDADFGRHTTFQVLKITGYAGKLKTSDVRGMWAYCDADVEGRFRCSSDLLNAIYKMCERSARQNIQQGMISVDADREQSPWTADSWNIGIVLLYNDRDTMMMDKVVRDYAGAQLSNGDFPSCCPAQRFDQIPEWSMYWPMLLWQQYLFSGDEGLLREMAPRLAHFLDWLKQSQDPATKLLDPPGWRISDYAGGNMPSRGFNMATAGQYYENLRIASRIFSILGQTNQSEDCLRQAQAVKAGINEHLFNGEYYLAQTDRKEMFPLASAWALRFDIEPEADKSKIVDVIEKGGKPDIGGYGGDAFYSGMFNAGGGAFAVRDLARYRPMLDSNKANWEGFPRNGEANHAWTSYPGYLFQKYILGIQPTSGAFATFDVRPETGGLTYAEGTVPTVKGLITTRWEKDNSGNFSLRITVPANTCASIYIPKLSNGSFSITESGKQIWPMTSKMNDPGILAVTGEDSSIKCVVAAGEYRFREAR